MPDRPDRRTGHVPAAVMLAIALAVSPYGIMLATGRTDLSFRISATSWGLVAFLLVTAFASVTRGRARTVGFYLMALAFPVAVLCGVELAAAAFRLADRVAPLEDGAALANARRYPTWLLSDARFVTRDGLTLYRPRGDGPVRINGLGLRTGEPSSKAPGEWRVALTGGSAAWGWRVLDEDTVAARLQAVLDPHGSARVRVYNFGIESVRLGDELALLRRFREAYGIDQVVFYTGANDVTIGYVEAIRAGSRASRLAEFELVKLVQRVLAAIVPPNADTLARFDAQVIPALLWRNTLRDEIAAADRFCAAEGLRCDFVLQPMLLMRKDPVGREAEIARAVAQIYPRFRAANAAMYRDATAAGPAGRVHDLSTLFDGRPDRVFVDATHVNEIGNRIVAEHLARALTFGPR